MNPLANLNPPQWLRNLLYLLAAFGELVRRWAVDEHWLDQPTDRLVSGVIALVLLMAAANSSAQAAAAVRKTVARRRARKRVG